MHRTELYQLPPGQNYQIHCHTCGGTSGILLSKKRKLVEAIQEAHELTGEPMPLGIVPLIDKKKD